MYVARPFASTISTMSASIHKKKRWRSAANFARGAFFVRFGGLGIVRASVVAGSLRAGEWRRHFSRAVVIAYFNVRGAGREGIGT